MTKEEKNLQNAMTEGVIWKHCRQLFFHLSQILLYLHYISDI